MRAGLPPGLGGVSGTKAGVGWGFVLILCFLSPGDQSSGPDWFPGAVHTGEGARTGWGWVGARLGLCKPAH